MKPNHDFDSWISTPCSFIIFYVSFNRWGLTSINFPMVLYSQNRNRTFLRAHKNLGQIFLFKLFVPLRLYRITSLVSLRLLRLHQRNNHPVLHVFNTWFNYLIFWLYFYLWISYKGWLSFLTTWFWNVKSTFYIPSLTVFLLPSQKEYLWESTLILFSK